MDAAPSGMPSAALRQGHGRLTQVATVKMSTYETETEV